MLFERGERTERISKTLPTTDARVGAKAGGNSPFGMLVGADFSSVTDPDEYEAAAPNSLFGGATELTMFCLFKANSLTTGTNENRLFLRKGQAASGSHTNLDFCLDIRDENASGDQRLCATIGAAASLNANWVWDANGTHNVQINVGEWYCGVAVWRINEAIRLYINGIFSNEADSAHTSAINTSTNPEVWVAGRSDSTDDFDGVIALAGAFTERLSEEDAIRFSADPFNFLYEPRRFPIFSAAAAASGLSLVRRPWKQKPPPSVGLDRTNYYLQRADSILDFRYPLTYDVLGNYSERYQAHGNSAGFRQRAGVGTVLNTAGSGFTRYPISDVNGADQVDFKSRSDEAGAAFLWHGVIDSVEGFDHYALLNFYNAGNKNVGIKSTGLYPFFWPGTDSGVATTGITLGQPTTIIGWHKNNTANDGWAWWIDGRPAGQGTSINASMGGVLQAIGGTNGQGGVDGDHSLLVLFKEGWKPTDADAARLAANPYQFFQPRLIPIIGSAAAGFTPDIITFPRRWMV